jgi:hypothetical protein
MGIVSKLFGTPPEHALEKRDHEVVTLPEFDITQYSKKLGVSTGGIIGIGAAALKVFEVEQVTSPMVVAALGVTAAAVLGVSLVMAVDLASRAYLTAKVPAEKEGEEGEEESSSEGPEAVAMPPGTMAWLQGDERPHPVLAIAADGKSTSYLVASGATVDRGGTQSQKAIDGVPKWESAERVQALKPADWP